MYRILHKKRSWVILFVLQLLLFFGISKSNFFTTKFIDFFEWRKEIQQSLCSNFKFSVGDIVYVILGLFFILLILTLFSKKWRKKGSLVLFISLNISYFIYQTFWGTMYFEPPMIERLSYEKINIAETKKRYLKYINICNETRKQASEDENGVFKILNIDVLKKEIVHQQGNLSQKLNFKKNNHIISIKPSLFEKIMNKTGILGYYNPFTAEAQYNPNLPDTMIPFTLAHETAHQLGYAREQEANFVGFLMSEHSKNTDLKYSTLLFVLKQLNQYITQFDADFLEENGNLISEKVKRDLQSEADFRKNNKGLTKRFFLTSNDLFLKSNQQKGHVSYSYFIELFLRYP